MSNRAYAQYSISDIRDGVDGVGILSIEEQYCKTTTATAPSESYSGWSTSQPEYEANAYIWTRSKITWDNEVTDPNHITYTDPVLATTYKTLYTDVINKILDIATEDENGNWSLTQGVIENTYAYTDPNTSQPVSLSQIGASITTSKNGILQTVSNTYATQTSLNSEINARKATYVTSSTNTGTAAKIGVCSNFELYNGAVITCLFTQANTTASPTLNVNGTGAIAIKASDGSNLSEAQYKWSAGSSFTLVYVEQSSTKKYWRLQDSNILTRFDVAETTIDQTANNILIKATKTNATNSDKQAGGQAVIESLINVAPQGIKISADKVNIEGAAIFTSGRLSTTNLNSTIDGRIPEIPDDLSDLTDSTGIVPTKVSDLTNDSNFQTDSDVSGTIISATTLYYASNSATPPSKPTAHISTNNTGTRGQWNIALPTYNASYPYLYICTENKTKGGTYSWTSVEQTTYTSAISSIKSAAEGAAPKTSAIAEEQRIYYRSKVNTKPNGNGLPTTWVTETGNKYNTNATTSAGWSRKITPISTGTSDTTKYLYLWTCIQKKTVSGTVTYGDILLDDSTTVIDGGNIVTGTVTANQIAATAITTQKLAADAIKSANYDAGPTNSPYSSGGTFLDLTTGNIYTPNFGVQSTTGQAYLNGQIIATSGTIGDDSGNYWSIGNTTDSQGDTSASIIGNGTAYIQDGDFQMHNGVSNYSKGSINTQWYTTPSGGGLQITYPYYNSKYYDYGMTSPILNTSDSRYYNQTVSQNFLYIRKSPSNAIPTVASDWQYLFRVDKDGIAYVSNLYVNGTDIATMISNGVEGGAYLPTTGGTVNGSVTITGTLTATASKAISDSDGLQINSTYVKKSGSQMSDSGYISRNGKSVSWHKGRDGALIKTISINAYSPLASLKTTNGSWDIGVYNNSSYYDDLLFTYVTDTLYSGTNTIFTKQIKFLENGHIVADGFDGKATSAGTADSATTATTATTSTWTTLIKPITDTTTASASTWSIPSGSKQVWGERFSDSTLKYTPSGGSATTITDTGDLVLFLTPNATSNLATLNMKIDGTYYGSFSGNLTGIASSANKINTDAGSGTQPVYFSNGVPVATTYALNKTVPADAKFTDTTYTAATAAPGKVASASAQGTSTNYARQDHTHGIDLATGDSNGQVKIAGSNVSVKGLAALAYKASLGASDVGLGNVTNNKQVKGLSSGTTSGNLVTWGSDGYTVADSGIAKGSITTKITLSGTDYSVSSNTITITKANLQSAVQDTSYVLMTAEERSKLSSIAVSSGGTIDFSGVTASAPLTATVNQTTKAVNLTHNTSGVTAGTYRSVTVNTYGHVTGGTNPTTLSGYGITDAKIASGVITLGSNTITPLTADSTIAAGKVSGTVAAATKATQDGDGNTISSTYVKKTGDTMTNLLTLYREGTTANNYPAGIKFSVKDTTTSQTYSNAFIYAYQDHSSTTYGTNMVIHSGGGMFIGAGESPANHYSAKGASYNGEEIYITSDGGIYIQGNGNTIANRVGLYVNASHEIVPIKADVSTNNIGSIGTSTYKWANMYATTFHGALDGNATTATTAGSVTGTVAVGNGGTGKTSWTQWGIVYASATNALSQVSAGTSGQVLTSKGSAAPDWTNQSALSVGSATNATYSSHPKITNSNEIRFDVNTKPSSAIDLYIGYKWSDGTGDAKINAYRFYNGNTGLAALLTSNLIVQGSTTASSAYDSTNPKITFKNNGGDQNLQLVFTDFDSIAAPASLTLVGNQSTANGGEKFIAPNVRVTNQFQYGTYAYTVYNSTTKSIDFIFN